MKLPAQVFEDYFEKSPCDLALKIIEKEKEGLLSDCNSWLSDLDIVEDRLNERIKAELDSKIDSMYRLMIDSISEQIQRVFAYATFEYFIDEYFQFRTKEYKLAKQLIYLFENDKENFDKVAQFAKNDKELFIQLLKSLE